jgi:tRNA nucleotidyltransferase (CCA-adding enzyme)
MCQSKEQGGRRCAGRGQGSSFFPATLVHDLPEGGYVCPRCGTTANRASTHSCKAKDLVALSSFQAKIHALLSDAGYKPLVVGEDVRYAVQAKLNGENDYAPEALYVNDDANEIEKAFADTDVTIKTNGAVITVEDEEGNTVAVRTGLESSPYSIDTMQYDPESGVIQDPNGGMADIRDGVIRHTEPFEDDPASVLRGAVLASQTGYSVAPETLEAAKEASHLYESIPKSEVWRQWEDLSLSKEPSKALTAIHEMGWEKNFPELAAIRGVPQSDFWHPEGPVEIHTGQAADIAARKADEEGLNKEDRSVVVMAAIAHDLGKSESTVIDEDGKISSAGHEYTGTKLSKKFLRGIGASEAVRRQVPLIVYAHMHHAQAPTERAVRRLMRKLDNDGKGTTIELWARVAEADKAGRGTAGTFGVRKEFLDVVEMIRKKDAQPSKLLVNGDFLTKQGYTPGSHYGEMIKAAKEAHDNNEIGSEEDAVKWVKSRFPL